MHKTTTKTIKIRNLIPWTDKGGAYDYNKCKEGDIVLTYGYGDDTIHIAVNENYGSCTFLAINYDKFHLIPGVEAVYKFLTARKHIPRYHHKRLVTDTGQEEILFTYDETMADDGSCLERQAIAFQGINPVVKRKKFEAKTYQKLKEYGVF